VLISPLFLDNGDLRYSRRKTRCNRMWKWECGSVVEHFQEMNVKTKELVWKENHGIQNIWI